MKREQKNQNVTTSNFSIEECSSCYVFQVTKTASVICFSINGIQNKIEVPVLYNARNITYFLRFFAQSRAAGNLELIRLPIYLNQIQSNKL